MTARALIAAILAASIVLVGLLGIELNKGILERVREERLQRMTLELRTRLETRLDLGLALAADGRAQAMLEDAVARMPEFASIEIDSPQGTVLFDSDRTLRGQPVPLEWQAAAHAAPDSWRAARKGEHSLGTQLRDASGKTAGYFVWTHEEGGGDAFPWHLLATISCIAAVTAALAMLAGSIAERHWRCRRRVDLSLLNSTGPAAGEGAVGDAVRVLARAREELEYVDREANRIAGLRS